jgi:PhzF family phenazine biosynthesis protein
MKQKIYQVDAFASKLFSGNPAAVCPLQSWPDDEVLQNIALENNLAETAFYLKDGDRYQIRWFTPKIEVDLCGHATLAAAFVLFFHEGHGSDMINFYSQRSGELTVNKKKDYLTMNFPADTFKEVEIDERIRAAFDQVPLAAYRGKTDYMLVFENELDIVITRPRLQSIARLDARGVIITARGTRTDFVSRFFAPQSGIDEDPVTGSAHTTLAPYWAAELGKMELSAAQLSPRGGTLFCKVVGDRVEISGQARLFMSGEIHLE